MSELKLRGRIARFLPSASKNSDYGFDYIEDGVIEVANGQIKIVEDASTLEASGYDLASCEHLPNSLMMAGFVDAHVHAPQLDVIGSYGEQLLDWLNKYTFPAEIKFADPSYSYAQSERFIELLLANGSTTAMVYTTSFAHSTDHLFECAHKKGMRLLAGKVWMDRNAPQALLDSPEAAATDTRELIEKWHNTGRLGYALTPRFAGTSTPAQLKEAQRLINERPDLWVQTHLSENKDEITWTLQLFPEATDYLNTYERYDLLTDKTLFGHCIHLSDSETKRIADSGAGIAFCPSSNLFLGSGLFKLSHIKAQNIPVALCSDIGGGTSLSPFTTMGDAYKVCQLQGYSLTAKEAFYLASLGAAQALWLDNNIGSLSPGYEADLIVIDSNNHPFLQQRVSSCKTIEEELFVYMTCGDERLIQRTYIAGALQYQNPLGGAC